MSAEKIAVIREAIKSLRQLTFDTVGDDGVVRHRLVCAHVLGMKEDEWHVFTWQINDDSEHGFKEGAQRWRCFDLEDLSNIQSQAGEWHCGWTGGKRPQSCVDVIDTSVDAAHAAEVRSISPSRTL